ncbi:FAD-dependent oxidoreductase [Streptomyces sp. JJ36]|uniref:FAD-dependent oxidoreductase n=1 Tax=Streptomyces sp. JJ36 TaxID=2736645 RepID=UPI001F3DA145|nr:FAD-dependent oxidoreductase [Streptomyces sp. JJ36]MCF6525969.1 FAD-dependent oxidoreductase [Streptomyces sp. JJ36]
MLRVAVVGSGPSGVYAAQGLTAPAAGGGPQVAVDVLDRLPCPYGLVRYGVAPDHEKIKSLQNSLRTVLEQPGVRFLGNVEVGAPPDTAPEPAPGADARTPRITPAGLLELYHAVVYCVGAADGRRLGIPGEDLRGSTSATEFVSWYSAHPDAAGHSFDLSARSAVVIGVGNVAVDVARVLARGAAELRQTDVPHAALGALAGSAVTDITLVGRRGPAQARFTTKELRELGALPDAEVRVRAAELARDPACEDPSGLPAVARRNLAVLREWAARPPATGPARRRRIELRFYLRPVALLDDGHGAVRAVRFERTAPADDGTVTGTGEYEDLPARLVLRSVGYRGAPPAGLPCDAVTGTVPHAAGRVLRDGVPAPGEYVAGWIKRGPTGVIGSNRPCAKETVTSLLADAEELLRRAGPRPGDPLEALRAAGLRPVVWTGWQAIEEAEAALGRSLDRGRVKIPDWPGLLAAAEDRR